MFSIHVPLFLIEVQHKCMRTGALLGNAANSKQGLLFFARVTSKTALPCFCCSAVIGELDEEKDAQVDLTQVRAPPLKPVRH